MKKLLSILLVLALVASCWFCVFADEEEDAGEDVKEPDTYLWMKDQSTDSDYSITFAVPGSKFTDGTFKITARANFENCEGTVAYVNCYIYDQSGSLVSYSDFAAFNVEGYEQGTWGEFKYEFNPCDGSYGDYEGKHIDASEIGKVTFGVGFYQATGIVKVQNLQLNKDLEVVWSKGFAGGLDLENDADIDSFYGLTAGDEEILWGVVRPEVDDNGNIATKATLDAPVGGGAYTASLNDGVAFAEKAYTGDWYGFNKNQNVETVEYDGADAFRGTAILDFGKVVDFTAVRAHMWDGASSSGIGTPAAIIVSASNDGEAWDELGSLTLGEAGTIYWAEKELDEVASAQFVKFDFYFRNDTWLFVNEIEVIGAGIIDDPEESSEPAEESKEVSKEESKDPVTPKTGDAGMIALAVVSVITLAGVVVVKNRK